MEDGEMESSENSRCNYLIDIDGTVCEDIPNEESHRYGDAKVIPGAVEWVNGLRDAGHTITFFTARETKDRGTTIVWLMNHGFKFHNLIMDKPRGGNYVWVDNLDVTGVKYQGSYSDLQLPSQPSCQ